ncbi:MAG TPA: hypothetical protein DHU96_28405 [Actinobacteria bacterium]|nr:hypothetical protein [Actinomycetota bacterium]
MMLACRSARCGSRRPTFRRYRPRPAPLLQLISSTSGNGSGLLGLPGDVTPPSRYVRAAVLSTVSTEAEDARAAVNQSRHETANAATSGHLNPPHHPGCFPHNRAEKEVAARRAWPDARSWNQVPAGASLPDPAAAHGISRAEVYLVVQDAAAYHARA